MEEILTHGDLPNPHTLKTSTAPLTETAQPNLRKTS